MSILTQYSDACDCSEMAVVYWIPKGMGAEHTCSMCGPACYCGICIASPVHVLHTIPSGLLLILAGLNPLSCLSAIPLHTSAYNQPHICSANMPHTLPGGIPLNAKLRCAFSASTSMFCSSVQPSHRTSVGRPWCLTWLSLEAGTPPSQCELTNWCLNQTITTLVC